MQHQMLFLAVLVLGAHSTAVGRSVPVKASLNVDVAHKEVAKKTVVPAAPAKAAAAPVKVQATPKESAPKAKVASFISPPLKDVESDKKFFGPGGDYPNDKRPVPDQKIMDKLKGPEQPYPALQSKADFDRDYVKDENDDKGAWKAQFEYDRLRNKIAQEEADAKAAEAKAGKEGRDVDDAQKKADDASKNAKDAQDGVDNANKGGGEGGSGGSGDGNAGGSSAPPSKEELEKLKKMVADAEANYEKEKKEFEECKKQLKAAQDNIEELKAKQEEMEKQMASDTKLWVETKTVRLDLQNAKRDAASAKKVAAEARLKVSQNTKADLDKVLAKEKAQSEAAQKSLHKEKADLEQAKKDLEKATLRLQKLRGYAPANSATPAKSGASNVNAGLVMKALAGVVAVIAIGY